MDARRWLYSQILIVARSLNSHRRVANALTFTTDRRRVNAGGRDPDPLRLLIADDDADYSAYIRVLARRIGFQVDIAADGEMACQKLERESYDVAVVDHEMPRLNGLGVIACIRSTEATKGLYAVMLTGREDIDTKLRAIEAGFDDFVTKSSSEAEVVAKLVAAKRLAARQRTLNQTVRELYGLATRDELTTVFNRRFFVDETERMLSEGAALNLLLFDLDGFKQINDRYGHLAGDRVLRDVGILFQKSTRPPDLIARYGGDEFVMVINDLTIEDVESIAARLAADLRALRWSSSGISFGISVTTGLSTTALLPRPTLEQLVDAADHDLYTKKWLRNHEDPAPAAAASEAPSTARSRHR